MSKQLPCLIFSDDCVLCDEQDVLAVMREIHGLNQLQHSFFLSLGKEYPSFSEFCKTRSANLGSSYRIYRLTQFADLLFAFCEKNVIFGAEYTMVFLSRDISEFYRFMSPSSEYFKDTANRVIYELLYLKNRHFYDLTSLTPEAFLSLSRVPHLAEAILNVERSSRYCDICAVTEHALSHICKSAAFSCSDIRLHLNDAAFDQSTDTVFHKISVEAYTSLLQLSLAIAASLASDHSIELTVTRSCATALVTVTSKSNRPIPQAENRGVGELSVLPHPADSFAKIASIISHISNLVTTYSFAPDTKELSLYIESGVEIQPVPDFKFSDPAGDIENVLCELELFLKSIS